MMSWIVVLVVIAAIAGASGAYFNRGTGKSGWLIVLGIIMLLPGLCGSIYLGLYMFDSRNSPEAQAYAILFASVAVPSIQLTCFLLWLISRKSDVVWFRTLTHWAGWFGAATAAALFLSYVQMAMNDRGPLVDKAIIFGIGLLIAGVPFLIGGLQAIRIRPEGNG
jgi:hypothetical protein